MKVRELMSTSVSCVRPETSVGQVARQMRQENIGSLPVCDDLGHVHGVVTDRDIVIRSVSQENTESCAKEIMTMNPVSVSPDMTAHEAALTMAKHQVRRLPVVDNSRLVGYLSMADLARKSIYVDEAGDALSAISKPAQMT